MVEIKIIDSLYSLNSVENRFIFPFYANSYNLVSLLTLAFSPCLPIISEAFSRTLLSCAAERAAGHFCFMGPSCPHTTVRVFNTPSEVIAWLA